MEKKKKKDTETNLKQIINMKIAREDLPKYVKLYPKWLLKIQRGKYRGTTMNTDIVNYPPKPHIFWTV